MLLEGFSRTRFEVARARSTKMAIKDYILQMFPRSSATGATLASSKLHIDTGDHIQHPAADDWTRSTREGLNEEKENHKKQLILHRRCSSAENISDCVAPLSYLDLMMYSLFLPFP